MRRMILVIGLGLCLWPLAGCSKLDQHPVRDPISADAREIGRPWPVLIGTYHDFINVLVYNDRQALFSVGGRERFRLDYRLRKVTSLRPDGDQPRQTRANGDFTLSDRGDYDALSLNMPEGAKEISASVVRGEGKVAQTNDLSGLAFYETDQDHINLVYYETTADRRSLWHVSGAKSGSLSWSPSGRYLLEENGGRLTVFARDTGGIIGKAQGTKPSFAASGPYLVFQRADGRPGIMELKNGYNWPLVPKRTDYQLKDGVLWTPNGERLAILAGRAPAADAGLPPYLLYLYDIKVGKLLQYPLAEALDLPKCALLFQADPKDLPNLIAAAPKISRKPLAAIDTAHYLLGSGSRLDLMDSSARFTPLCTFPGTISLLKYDAASRRLLIVAGQGKTQLFAWRLPDLEYLKDIFPGRGDLMLGRLRLGDKADSVRALLGQPQDRETAPDPRFDNEACDTWRYTDLSAAFRRGRLCRIISSTPDFATRRGISIGSTLQQIHESYGRPSYQISDYLSYEVSLGSIDLKVAFKLDQSHRVTAILVFRTN